jgi:hypothetical protein
VLLVAAGQPEKNGFARAGNPHQRPKKSGQYYAPETETQGVVEPPHNYVGGPLVINRIVAKQKLWNFVPGPLVIEPHIDAVDEKNNDDTQQGENNQVNRFVNNFTLIHLNPLKNQGRQTRFAGRVTEQRRWGYSISDCQSILFHQ